jgi:dTDP-4-amino-4,6-dideoxygalactose transaminase
VDIDAETFNLSVEALAAKLKVAEASRRLPKVLIVVHFGGQSCAMESIAKLSRTYGFRIIEDASHAIGARYRGRAVGCCEFSDITVFSFHPVKIITTAEGGAAVTNDPALAETMERLRSHGITRDPGKFTNTAEGPWYYEQTALGFNYRLNDLQAALGLSQITRLDMYVRRRQELAHRYKDALRDLPVMPQQMRAECYSAYHLYSVRLRSDGGAPQRLRVFGHLRAAGVGVNVHYMPIHLQPYYRTLGFRTGDFPAAESYYAEALTLPLYPGLTEAQQDRVVALLKEAVD